jgi:cleavage stimulation factor subunit 1
LEDDGYHGAATAVSNATLAPSNSALPPNRLQTLAAIGLTLEKDRVPGASMETYSSGLSSGMIDLSALQAIKGVDFDLELQEPASKRPYPNYQTRFITTHKNSVRCAKFSPDGKVIATGSADTSIKLLDVQKMVNYSQSKNEGGDDFQGARPVLRTLYDHTQAINDIDFHPTLPLLASASRDNTIKFYDYHSSMKKSFKYMQDSSNIRSISFHPSGDYIVAGTDNPLIRLYDINTLQCYVSPNGESNHLGPINQIRYGHDGKLFASCSKDGQIKLWDTVSFRCVQTFSNAHGGLEVRYLHLNHIFRSELTRID